MVTRIPKGPAVGPVIVVEPKGDAAVSKTKAPAPVPERPLVESSSADRARVAALGQLPERVANCVAETPLGDLLARLGTDAAPTGAEAVELVFALRAAGLHRGDRVAVRKAILDALPKASKSLHKSAAARTPRPSEADLARLLLPAGDPAPVLDDLKGARKALADLDDRRADALAAVDTTEGSAATLAAVEAERAVQASIVEGFERWPVERFAPEIAAFRETGQAVAPARAGRLLHGLRTAGMSGAERAALAEALTGDCPSRPPTVEALFTRMTGAPADPAKLEAQIRDARTRGDVDRAATLTALRESLTATPTELLEAPIAAFERGVGIPPEHAAPLAATLDRMDLSGAALDKLKAALLDRMPESTGRVPRSQVAAAIQSAEKPADLVRLFTGEVWGRPPLPLDRKQLTRLVSQVQGDRGAATLDRVRLLDGRAPEDLDGAERKTLTQLDRKVAGASRRLDDLKAARAGVNAVRGERWLDKLEIDVLAGGAVGVPGFFSGSAIAGVAVNEADPTTGAREKGALAYVMPAFSVGGYGKLDVRYTRSEGVKVSGGGGADFFGVWAGPGGRSWGNIFAGGFWLPQIINLGVGYGIEDERPYGALILSTFWPPFSTAAGRVDTVVRHPSLALGAERGAEIVRKVSESDFIQGGHRALETAGGWVKGALRPIVGPVRKALDERRNAGELKRLAHGLPESMHHRLDQALRAM